MAQWFRADYIHAGYIRSHFPRETCSGGRGYVTYFRIKNHHLVHRHYHRGGLMARVFGDRYLRTGIMRRRCTRELLMLDEMRNMGLPVPQPIAASSCKKGIFYRCDLITQRIEGAISLAESLKNHRLEATTWYQIGVTLRKFHRANVWHADLNAGNILLDASRNVFLVDFDRCRFRVHGKRWRQSSLDRLQRSLSKIRQVATSNFHYDPVEFAELMRGYSS